MNKVILIGNITKDIELKTTAGGTSVATFTVACQRNYKNAEGRYETDFINCVAWKNTADFLSKYFGKGSSIAVTGRMQTRSYEAQDGGKRYVTEVIVEETEFVGKKKKQNTMYRQMIYLAQKRMISNHLKMGICHFN